MKLAAELKDCVEPVLGKPEAGRRLNQRLERFATGQGMTIEGVDIDGLTDLCTDYVRAVASMLAACNLAEDKTGTMPFADTVLDHAAAGFLKSRERGTGVDGPCDLLEEAYFACRFVAGLSETYRAVRGQPLVDVVMDCASPVVRLVIGEPAANRLDQEVKAKIALAIQQVQFSAMEPWSVDVAEWKQTGKALGVTPRMVVTTTPGYWDLRRCEAL